MKNITKILVALLVTIMAVSSFAGCSITKVVTLAEGNGIELTSDSYVFKYYFGVKQYDMLGQVGLEPGTPEGNAYLEDTDIDGKKAIDICRESALDDAVGLMVEVNKAKAEGITITDEDKANIDAELAAAEQNAGGSSQFDALLKTLGIDREIYNKISIDFKYSNKLQEKYTENSITVSDEEIDKKFADDKYITAKHILFQTVDSTTGQPLSEEEIASKKALAEDTLAKIKAGQDFDSFASLNEDPGSQQSPDGYTFTTGQMVSSFETAAYALEENAVSEIVESEYGYHIIKRVPLIKDENTKLSITNIIKSDKYIALVDQWTKEAGVKKYNSELKEVELPEVE